jgi:hypothetical protein
VVGNAPEAYRGSAEPPRSLQDRQERVVIVRPYPDGE